MFKFKTPQKIFEIGRVKIGGQPGQVPAVMIGSIFYMGQKMVTDEAQGIFEKKKAEEIVNKIETMSDITGVPFMFDIVGTKVEAFRNYINFIADHSEAPFLLDAISPRIRMKAIDVITETGLQERTVYNSIYKGVRDPELEKIKDSGIKASIVQAENVEDNSVAGKLRILDEVMAMAKKAGITKPLIDTAIPAFQPDMGSAVRAIQPVKEKYGAPVGVGSGNVVTTCGWCTAKFDKYVNRAANVAQHTIMQTVGANWLMYGPCGASTYVFPSVAITDAYLASAAAELGTEPASQEHPIFKIFF